VNSAWVEWHREYDDPSSSLSRRRAVVQAELEALLTTRDVHNVISMCAGDGEDVLPVLARHDPGMPALLVELDPALADRARARAAVLRLASVAVETADAGTSDPYLHAGRAQVVLACGVFGNISPADAATTIAALPGLLDDGGAVIWTRGRGDDGPDPSEHIRHLFADLGFVELSFTAPEDARFRVGVHQLAGPTAHLTPGRHLFRFDR